MAKSIKSSNVKLNIQLNAEQREAEKLIQKQSVTLITGKAGTGKTLVAVKYALDCMLKKEIDSIVITRPAIGAGENLGFLPGDLQEKLEPYLIPIYENFVKIFDEKNHKGENVVEQLMAEGKLIIVPVAFMRGRTFERSVVILDEAQNMNQEQMKMAITRLGVNSKMVVCGDLLQCDLGYKKDSGLYLMDKILRKELVPNFSSVELCQNHRLDIVKYFLDAFDTISKEDELEVPFEKIA